MRAASPVIVVWLDPFEGRNVDPKVDRHRISEIAPDSIAGVSQSVGEAGGCSS